MGNQHSASHPAIKPRKNVHWKSAGRPGAPGKPDIIPILSDDEPNAITLRWTPAAHDGGAPLHGYQVECNRLGSSEWIRTAPPVVLRPELVLTGLDPPHRYQFRVAALNAVGRSEYSELSDVLTVGPDKALQEPPLFLEHLEDVTALENDKTEFRVTFTGVPPPTIAWFKDDYEIFSSRRTAITTNESSSILIFHQTLPSDEGEIRCTATNRSGHAVTRAHLALEAAPKLRYPRQYEDGLLYEINETIFLKTTIVGKPTPTIEWRHDGQPVVVNERIEISNTPKFSILKIHTARRSDRGEYQIHAKNSIGEDTAAFLVTVTAPPEPPRCVSVARQVDKSVTLDWEPPEDDGGCRIGNYVVEYYRNGWNVWLKATTSRKTSVTLFDLIEGSEYRFRVKAESPYGMSSPSMESASVRIPGRPVDMEFLAVESRIINEAMTREDGEEMRVSPAPRRKRTRAPPSDTSRGASAEPPPRQLRHSPNKERHGSHEFMLVLYPENIKAVEKTGKRESFQLDMDSLSPPPISLSAPELSTRPIMPFKALRNSVSSTELLHERAMARCYKAVAMKEEQSRKGNKQADREYNTDIPYNISNDRSNVTIESEVPKICEQIVDAPALNPIEIKADPIEDNKLRVNARQASQDSVTSENRWQHMSFDEDYTASTVSTDEEYSDEGSLNGDMDRRSQYSNEEDTYNPRDKMARSSPNKEFIDEEEVSEHEELKPLPLPDPNFIPKPILKRRDVPESPLHTINSPKSDKKITADEKPKKEEKLTIFKKITKIPGHKSTLFPKLLNKKEPEKTQEDILENEKPKAPIKTEKFQDKITEEGRTIIDYYGNIVKEFGSQKKTTTPLYLNTEDLKTVAEKQLTENKEEINKEKKVVKTKKSTVIKKVIEDKTKVTNSIIKQPKLKQSSNANRAELSKNDEIAKPQIQERPTKTQNTHSQQIVLKKTERATIVIPINYQELEKKAKVNVRSAIDYTVDVCLLLLAFWVYFFKDERLAIPFLILIIYRQLQETLTLNIPDWFNRNTPNWLKKTS